jgi:hypothetical protein
MKPVLADNAARFAFLLLGSSLLATAAQAELFLGGSIGSASVAIDTDTDRFDENDGSWKVFGGYEFDLSVINFGIEGGYRDLGSPSSSLGSIDTTAIDLYAVIGFDFSFIGIFGKAGLVAWDADILGGGSQASDDGTDSAYGVGVNFDFASLELRFEYELFDIKDTDDVDMLSVGLAWHF